MQQQIREIPGTPPVEQEYRALAEAEVTLEQGTAPEGEKIDSEHQSIDTFYKAVKEVVERVYTFEVKEAVKIGRSAATLAETFKNTVRSFQAPGAFIEGARDFAQDPSDSAINTTETDWIRRGFGWLTGKHVEARTSPEDKHGGIFVEGSRTLLDVVKRFPEAFLNEMVAIPSDLARHLEEWSPNTTHERRQLAQEMEARARETRDRILAGIRKEEDALYRQGRSPENIAKLAELSDKGENVESDYADEVAKAREIAPGTLEGELKNFAWVSATTGLDALSYTLGIGHVIKEAGQALASGIRGERRKLFAERAPNAPYSQDVISINVPQEKTMGVLERLGDWMMTKAIELQDDRKELTDTLHEEVTAAKQKEASIMQDVISKRIEGLIEKMQLAKTKISKAELEEISHLTEGLNSARKGLLAAHEINAFIKRSRDLAKNDDAKLLMGYLSGRAINSIKNLEVIPLEARKALITELQEHPSSAALKAAESLIYASLDENVRVSGVPDLSPEQRAQLEGVQKLLRESVRHATDIYTSNLAKINAEIIKGLQAANRELKKAAAEAEMAQSKEKEAA